MSDQNTRIAIIDANKCRPKRCAQECKKVSASPCSFWIPLTAFESPARLFGWVCVTIISAQRHMCIANVLCNKGRLCIEVKPSDKIAFISEVLCIGRGICVKKFVPGAN